MRKWLHISLVVLLIVALAGCASMSRTQKGAVVGGGTGAVLGGIVGKASGNTAAGAIIGAAVGGAAGAYIGRYMDKQAEELERDLEGAKVERIGEGIKITFDSGILFAVNKADLSAASKQNLTNLATVLQKYEDTDVLIEGHTDSDGSDSYNMTLSEQRARSVSGYLVQNSVANARMSIVGYGESQPVADNATTAGKAANRRVEIAIMANDKLKKVAQSKG